MTEEQIQQQLEGLKGTQPYSAIYSITDSCNLRCRYCFVHPNPRQTTPETAIDVVNYLVKNWKDQGRQGQPSLTFFGGEPTLLFEKVMRPTVEYVRKNIDPTLGGVQFSLGVTSNGTLWKDEWIDFWRDNGCGLLLSIDGAKKTQEYNRPQTNDSLSSFDHIEKMIPKLLNAFPSLTFRSTLSPFSSHYMLENYLYAYKQGFRNYFITPDVRNSVWKEEDIEAMKEQYDLICQVMYIDIATGHPHLSFSDFEADIKDVFDTTVFKSSVKRCGLGTVSCGITTQGKIFGCQERNSYDEEDAFYLGDIYSGIDETLRERLLRLYLGGEKPENSESPERCDVCPIYFKCARLFCQSANYSATGSLFKVPDIACTWRNIRYEAARRFAIRAYQDKNQNVLNFIERCKGNGNACGQCAQCQGNQQTQCNCDKCKEKRQKQCNCNKCTQNLAQENLPVDGNGVPYRPGCGDCNQRDSNG